MFCKFCGKEIDDDSIVCSHCGKQLNTVNVNITQQTSTNDYDYPKTGIGVLLCLLLGIIGLIIGLCLYPANTEARYTFIKGWGITFVIYISLIVLIVIFTTGAVSRSPRYYY